MSSDGIKIGVEVVGAQQAAGQLDQVAQAARSADQAQESAAQAVEQSQEMVGQAAKEAVKPVEDLAEASETAAEKQLNLAGRAAGARNSLEGLRQVAQGGELAFAGLGKAVDGALSAIGVAGKWMGIVSLIGLVISAIQVMIGMWNDAKRMGVEAAEATHKRWEQFAEWLSQKREESFSATLEGIRAKAAETLEEVERLLAARDRLDNAEMAAQIAAIEADPNMAPEDKRVKELEIRAEFARRAEERRFGAIDAPVQAAQEQYDSAVAARQSRAERAAQARAQLDREEAEIEQARRRRGELDQQISRTSPMSQDWDALTSERSRLTQFVAGNDNESARAQRAARRRLAEEDERAGSVPSAEEQAAERELERRRRIADTEREVQTAERDSAAKVRESAMDSARRTARRAEIERSRTSTEEYDRDVDDRDNRRVGALPQARIDQLSKLLETGAGDVKNRAIEQRRGEAAELARLLEEAARKTQGEATVGELGALADAIRALVQSNEARDMMQSRTVLRLEREIRALASRGANGRSTP